MTWSPFARVQQTPEELAERAQQQADAQRRAKDERIDQQIRHAVTRALAEPTINQQIRDRAAGRNRPTVRDRLFGRAETDNGPESA
jgi:predicted transcriptional regulator